MVKSRWIGSLVVFVIFWGAGTAAPQTPQAAGAPFVKSVSFYRDWRLTQPIDTAVAPGTTLYTKIVFSEPMKLKVATDNTARPILYCRIGSKRIRYRIAKHGTGGADFVSGDAKPLHGGTDDYICKYTIPEGATGQFTVMVGKLSTDRSGTPMKSFYTHAVRLKIRSSTATPAIGKSGGAPNGPQPADPPVAPQTFPELHAVNMPDPLLRAAVVAKINEFGIALRPIDRPKKPTDPIYAGEMRKIEELQAETAGITSLIGLEHATNLKALHLQNRFEVVWTEKKINDIVRSQYKVPEPKKLNRISDLTPLENLTRLTVLMLGFNAVSDLTPLKKLTRLKQLHLEENEITDITPLATLTNLESLNLWNHYYSPQWAGNNRITNLTPLENLTRLTVLLLGFNAVSDLTPLRKLTRLKRLNLEENEITDIAPLANLTNLETLNLRNHYYSTQDAGNNKITSLAPLRNLRKLMSLEVNHNPIGGRIGVVQNFPKLKYIGIGCCGVSDLRPLFKNPELRSVYLVHSPLTVNDVPDIRRLEARGVRVEDGITWIYKTGKDGSLTKVFKTNNVERCLSFSSRQVLRAAPALQPQVWTEPDGVSTLWHDLSQVPEETDLMQNYPNPFNPETWIPYQLAEAAAVTLTLYDIHGRVVRTLDIGHQPAGVYQTKGRAAYWDGRNAQGEPVASGLYFYTFTAGEFTATRELLIRK